MDFCKERLDIEPDLPKELKCSCHNLDSQSIFKSCFLLIFRNMNIETLRTYCLSKPYATEDFPFDDTTLVFRVHNKIFACINLNRCDRLCLKCDPLYALELREHYPSIRGAWHWNKKYWNDIDLCSTLDEEFICKLIDHSYCEVVKKLPKKIRNALLKE